MGVLAQANVSSAFGWYCLNHARIDVTTTNPCAAPTDPNKLVFCRDY